MNQGTVYLDNIIFSLQRTGGISIVWYELLKRLLSSPMADRIRFLEYPNAETNLFRRQLDLPTSQIIRQPLACCAVQRYLNPHVKAGGKFIFHSSYYRTCPSAKAINVTTVHDFIYEHFMHGVKKQLHCLQKHRAIRRADHIVCAYRDTYHMPVSITRCSNNYGPYQFPEKLIPLVIRNILEGKKLPVYGQGLNIRDWLYVEDHCKAIDTVINHGADGSIYNVGGHNERRNIDIVRTIIRTVHDLMEQQSAYRALLRRQDKGPDGQTSVAWINDELITYVKDRLGHDQRYGIDPTKIGADLGWRPETTFDEGIVKTIRWYLDNHKWVEAVSGDDYQEYYDKMYSKR